MERALKTRPLSATDHTTQDRMLQGLVAVHDYPLLEPYSELFMDSWIEVSADDLDAKLSFSDKAMHFIPVATVVYRRAWLLAQAGRLDEARLQLERSIWGYPADFPAQSRQLEALAEKDPAHFAALLEFATQKNKEYLSAVSTK